MIQNNSQVLNVTVAEATLFNIVDSSQYPRAFWFNNLDDVNTMTLKFQESEDGGTTWADLIPDDEAVAPFSVPAGEVVFKKITNSNLVRLRGSGEGSLHLSISRFFSDNAITIRI